MPGRIARDREELAEAAYREGYVAGAREEWNAAREAVRLVMLAQAREGKEILAHSLELIGLGELLRDGGPMLGEDDAKEAWNSLRASMDPGPDGPPN